MKRDYPDEDLYQLVLGRSARVPGAYERLGWKHLCLRRDNDKQNSKGGYGYADGGRVGWYEQMVGMETNLQEIRLDDGDGGEGCDGGDDGMVDPGLLELLPGGRMET